MRCMTTPMRSTISTICDVVLPDCHIVFVCRIDSIERRSHCCDSPLSLKLRNSREPEGIIVDADLLLHCRTATRNGDVFMGLRVAERTSSHAIGSGFRRTMLRSQTSDMVITLVIEVFLKKEKRRSSRAAKICKSQWLLAYSRLCQE